MPYDVEMIRDFMDQLIWSLRVDHFEFTAGPRALNPELVEEVKRCALKRGILRLLSLFTVRKDKPELTAEQMQLARRMFAENQARERQEQLRHLEALHDVLDEACAHAAGRVIEIVVPASKILDGSFYGDQSADPSQP
jgi:hypothetical protein